LGLASLRLAPVQCVSFGHTATTMSEAIDWFVLPEDFVGSPAVFSERVLGLPRAAMPLAARSSPTLPARVQRGETVRIAVPGSTMKLNGKLFDAIAAISERARTPVEVQFFPLGAVGLVHVELTRAVSERLKGAIVSPELSHETYLQALNRCDLFLSPFPYGNMNSVIDCFQLGLPGVCLDGTEAHAHADGAFFARIGLPDELIAHTIEDYIGAAVRLIDNEEWWTHCRTIVARADLDAAFFAGDASLFASALAELVCTERK
jgi:predicted O-linked N-acetylglucosamine transferase (SPINDLY family)